MSVFIDYSLIIFGALREVKRVQQKENSNSKEKEQNNYLAYSNELARKESKNDKD